MVHSLFSLVLELKLTRRRTIHKDLLRYAELVHWMKAMDSKVFVNQFN